MNFKKNGFIDFLFGDWLYIRTIKRDFDQDELDARCSYAFYLMTDYDVGFDNRFHQKVNAVLTGERNRSVPDSIDTIQLIAKETIILFVGLTNIHALEFSNRKVSRAEKTTKNITRLFKNYKPGYEIRDTEFKEYLECSNLDEIGYIFVNKISNTFNIEDIETTRELRKTLEQFDPLFVKEIGSMFTKQKDALVLEMTKEFSPWSGILTVFTLLFVVLIINLIFYSPDKDQNILVEACRVNTFKCYTLKADYVDEYCESEYTTRGQTGSCIDSYIKKIYFNNGGYRSFERRDCSETRSSEWLCTDNDGDDWNIKKTEEI